MPLLNPASRAGENRGMVLGHELRDLREQETDQPSRCIVLAPGLIVAEDKEHLPIV
jgi:hypothetical protein